MHSIGPRAHQNGSKTQNTTVRSFESKPIRRSTLLRTDRTATKSPPSRPAHSMDASEGLEMTDTMEDYDDDEEDDNLLRANDDDGDEESDDDDDDDSSFWADLMAAWQQHLFAIVVAIVATFVAYFLHTKVLQRTTPPSYGRRQHHRAMMTTDPMLPKHLHLQDFQRTNNLSFCGFQEDVARLTEKQLKVMDFRLPSELTSSMELHFWADDDQTVINALDILKNDRHDMVSFSMDHVQINCMRRMSLDATRHAVKGVTYYYEKPSIESLYQQSDDQITMTSSDIGQAPTRKKLQEAYVSFTGFAAKFVNLHREAVLLFWDGRHASDRQLVGEVPPFQSLTTATRPGESFSISPVHDPSSALARWVVTVDDAVQYYEPEQQQQQQQHQHQTSQLTAAERHLLNFQKINREFAKDYLIQAKRTWLANFPRPLPVHPMWPASYLGQRHHQMDESSSPPVLSLEVVSILPRVFRIDNFLTADECQALIDLAIGHGMTASTVYAGGTTGEEGAVRQRNTRSSFNSWLKHNESDVTDVIYRKAARIFQVDAVSPTTIDDSLDAHRHSLVESLQVVRYKKGEQYTPHHDWVVPPVQHRFQPTRFATLLMYLNDDFEGGETNFPRAVTSNQHDGVSISPIKGSAVLFYNVLPDGNVDDLSQHGSSLVTKGVKVRRVPTNHLGRRLTRYFFPTVFM
jgi:prolyl 4-hydroxylase